MDTKELLNRFKLTRSNWLQATNTEEDECSILIQKISKSFENEERIKSIKKQYVSLSNLLNKGLITDDANEYFIPEELIAVIIFDRFVNDFQAVSDPGEKISFLNEFHRKLLRIELESKYLSIFLIELDNRNNGLINSLVKESIRSNDVFSFYHRFCDTIPYIDIKDLDKLLEIIIILKEKTSNDLSNGLINQAIRRRIKEHKNEGILLFDLIRNKEKGYEFLGDVLNEIFVDDRVKGVKKINEVFSSGNNNEIRAGLGCLGVCRTFRI